MIDRFGTAPDGSAVTRITLTRAGTTARLMTWGASLQDFRIAGVAHPLVLGSDRFEDYPARLHHFGAIVGPIANRIAQGRAPLNGRMIALEQNEAGTTHLHGGSAGSSRRNWTLVGHDAQSCQFSVTLPDGTGGLPGPVTLSATYRIAKDGALELEIIGTTRQATFCTPAHHSYWALGEGDLSHHRMRIAADAYLPVDARKIPTGAPVPLAGTRFDFRTERPVIRAGDGPLDHNFCLRASNDVRPVCTLVSGAVELIVSTDQPGLQVYDGAHLNVASGLEGRRYGPHAGIALEPQHWPDAPNHADYPPVTLLPDQSYRQRSRFHARRNPTR